MNHIHHRSRFKYATPVALAHRLNRDRRNFSHDLTWRPAHFTTDQLSAARGILNGLALSIPIWIGLTVLAVHFI